MSSSATFSSHFFSLPDAGRTAAAAWLAGCLVLLPVAVSLAAAGDGDLTTSHAQFCRLAQQLMVDTTLQSENVEYPGDLDGFIESKPREWPLQTHQYTDTLLPDGTRAEHPVTLSCKLKTAERINNALDELAQSSAAQRANAERSCRYIHEAMWEQIAAQLAASDQRPLVKPHFIDDDNTVVGPLWLRPWPYQVAYRDGDATYVRSKSLHVEHAWWIPMPASFMGTHYCHLIAPEYLRALATGEAAAPALAED